MGSNACILLPSTGIYAGLGIMLAEVFRELGWQPTLRHRAHSDVLQSDLLLCVGQCRNIDGLSRVLQQRRGRTPATIVWQLEPLPPPQLSRSGEETGLRAAAFDWGRMPRRLRQVLNCVVPFRTKLMRYGQKCLARPYSRQVTLEPEHQGWGRYNVFIYVVAMSEWRWLRLAHEHNWVDHFFASNQPRVQFLQSRGIDARMVPVGYHPGWGRDLGGRRDIEVLFLGHAGADSRGRALRQLKDELVRRGRKLSFATGAYGGSREELLNRARIVLSLLRTPHDLAGMRVLMGMACGALVVSEQCHDTGAFRAGEHFVMAPMDRLAETIDHCLTQEADRERIARQGNRFVTEELTLAKSVTTMLQRLA